MTRPLKNRLTLFAATILVLAAAVGWVAYSSWKETEKLRERFSTEQLRSFEIADHIQSSILTLNHNLTRYELQNTALDLQRFQEASLQLSRWIDEQKPQLVSGRERDLLSQIDRAYDEYLAAATNRTAALNESDEGKLARVNQTTDASLKLMELGRQLADAHRAVLQQFLITSQQSLTRLQYLRSGLLLLLVGSLVWLFITIYKEMIAPLQRKLVESHHMLERQEKLASLGVLAAGVAHEIRNPLTAIKARLFTQRKALARDSSAFEDSVVISSEINRLEQIVKDVLQFARPIEPKLTPIVAEPLLREICGLLAPQYQNDGISLTVDWCSDTKFYADSQQIKQVLINLIRNAAESIETQGQIVVRARDVRTKLNEHTRSAVILEVRDNGKGISPDVQKRLFDPFFSTKEGGTGLGLAIAARIVAKHGGALEFQTSVSRGTTFGVVLPAIET